MAEDIVEAAENIELLMLYPASPTNKLIDYDDRKGNTYHLFQTTISNTHSANATDIFELIQNRTNASMPMTMNDSRK
jgi:hypothetical protein